MARCGEGEAEAGQGASGLDDDKGRQGDGDGLEHSGSAAGAETQWRWRGLAAGPRDDDKDSGPTVFMGGEATAKVEGAVAEPMVKVTRLDGYGCDSERQPGLARAAKLSGP
ncbi:hypothetical protein E2562_039491 [Oryza meyeriana var. granulata]|uniref:DUF834 domain-containing protein n=1 Tax=Oryza meyeriana var. granulata TaxID=110450 RepID=A0A6G1DTC5_9ORYZ|nr:hypothetical protein E2562_039491 [Oryza meyeriana var. granulata]